MKLPEAMKPPGNISMASAETSNVSVQSTGLGMSGTVTLYCPFASPVTEISRSTVVTIPVDWDVKCTVVWTVSVVPGWCISPNTVIEYVHGKHWVPTLMFTVPADAAIALIASSPMATARTLRDR